MSRPKSGPVLLSVRSHRGARDRAKRDPERVDDDEAVLCPAQAASMTATGRRRTAAAWAASVAALSAALAVVLLLMYASQAALLSSTSAAAAGARSSPRKLPPSSPSASSTTLSDVFISVKTTGRFHRSRLGPVLDTWFPMARKQTWFFTDEEDRVLHEATGKYCKA